MPDSSIRPQDIKIGKILELLVFKSSNQVCSWLQNNRIEAYHYYNVSKGGRGKKGLDHVILIYSKNRLLRIYIEDKNLNDRRYNKTDYNDRIWNKFKHINLGDRGAQGYNFGILIGHVILAEWMFNDLVAKGVRIVNLPQLTRSNRKYFIEGQEKVTAEIIDCIREQLSLRSLVKQEITLQLLNRSKITVRYGRKKHVFLISKLRRINYFDKTNPAAFFRFRKTNAGDVTIKSQWKVVSRNPEFVFTYRYLKRGLWVCTLKGIRKQE